MSLGTRTYTSLVAQIKALSGSRLTDLEQTRIDELINLAAREAYGMSQWWERFLVVAEPRTVSRGQIESTEDSFYVYGAGTDGANGLYQRNGSAESNPKYSKYDSDGTTVLYEIEYTLISGGTWIIEDVVNSETLYSIISSDSTPPLLGWSVVEGATAPSPLLVDVAEIDTFLEVNRYDVYQDRVDLPIPGHAQGGVFRLHSRDIPDIAYVTYKKTLDDVYGDGTGGTTSTIPREWFNYMALYSAYMLMASARQGNASDAQTIAFRSVERALESELMRLEEQGTISTVGKRITTHLQNDSTLY